MNFKYIRIAMLALPLALVACSDNKTSVDDIIDIGDPIEKEDLPEDYYTGGQLGTVFNQSSSAYEQPAPAVAEQGLSQAFARGEYFFERPFTEKEEPFKGLGPLYIRTSCQHCHLGYGHGKRQDSYDADKLGNGYILMITDENDIVVNSFGWVAMSRAIEPFKPQFDEKKVKIAWNTYTDQWGNKFDDGETYDLIYPEVTLEEGCIYGKLIDKDGKEVPLAKAKVRLESSIGFIGTGLIDAIPDDSIMAQYRNEAQFSYLNPHFWVL